MRGSSSTIRTVLTAPSSYGADDGPRSPKGRPLRPRPGSDRRSAGSGASRRSIGRLAGRPFVGVAMPFVEGVLAGRLPTRVTPAMVETVTRERSAAGPDRAAGPTIPAPVGVAPKCEAHDPEDHHQHEDRDDQPNYIPEAYEPAGYPRRDRRVRFSTAGKAGRVSPRGQRGNPADYQQARQEAETASVSCLISSKCMAPEFHRSARGFADLACQVEAYL